MRRTVTLFVTLLLLWLLVVQLNDALAVWRVHVFAGGLFVVFAALTQPHRPGLTAVFLAGLVCDAHTPVAFGLHALLFAASHVLLFHVRDRLPRDDALSVTLIALLLNLALFIVFSLTQLHGSPASSSLWRRLAVDLLCSQLVVVLAAPWFVALQARSLVIARVPRFDLA